MTISILMHARALTRTVLTLAALAAAGCARGDPTDEPHLASLGVSLPTPAAAPASAGNCTNSEPGPALSLVTADGSHVRLIYSRGCGWKYRSGPPADDPLAVFVDGPTGYTFAWIRDAGWKFVGHVAD
jgi:hypothetical protein